MKKLLAASLFILPLAVQAQGYIEGQVGYTFIDDVDTKTYSSVETGSVQGSLDYDSAVAYGLEIGMKNFEAHNVLRMGLAWNRVSADLDKASIDISGGTLIDPISGSASSSELKSEGLNFDNDVNVYTANFYYDIPLNSSAFTPYLGFGIGMADIDNAKSNELALIGIVGGRYEISDGKYLGMKYQYIDVADFEDELGIEYDGVGAHMISATLGMDF